MRAGMDGGLTIGQLAERTGTAAGTLRMWESRYGFPRASRLASGHRRYSEEDAARVRDVLRRRETGLSLPAAIEQALARPDAAESIFAGVRRRAPELATHPLPKRLLVPMSRAIEDEAGASGERGLLAGSFQEERFYRQSEQRWRMLAAPAELSFVFADFERPSTSQARPAEVAVDRAHPLSREWALVWDAPGFAACLAARERTDPGTPDDERVFDAVWTVEHALVRAAAHAALELAETAAPELSLVAPERLQEPLEPDPGATRHATALTNRMLAYVAGA
jgi:DICT domain-containing protein